MAKQVLSVADFALILDLTNKEMADIEHWTCRYQVQHETDWCTEPTRNKPLQVSDEIVQNSLKTNIRYQDLRHLKESLQNLNIEVETPDVEVCDE